MGDAINYSTVEYQIQKLKSQNLIISDNVSLSHALSLYGYSNLIKSYRDPYIVRSDHGIRYRDGIDSKQIVSLYLLDKNLRNAVIAAMLDLEEHIKEASADVIASKYGTNPHNYLQFKNYANKRKRNPRFSLSSILNTLNKALYSDKDPIKYCRENHGSVPPWILFKGVYLSTIVNLVDQLKPNDQIALACKIYPDHFKTVGNMIMRQFMCDTLSLSLEYRNLSAHGGRIYNYSSNTAIRHKKIIAPNAYINNGFSQLLFVLSKLSYNSPHKILITALNKELSRHCSLYPQDITYLGQTLNVNIEPCNDVFITDSSKIYHIIPHCSGIQKYREITLNEALNAGYRPCKRCCKQP